MVCDSGQFLKLLICPMAGATAGCVFDLKAFPRIFYRDKDSKNLKLIWSYKKHLFEGAWCTLSLLYSGMVNHLKNSFSGKQARYIKLPYCESVWRRPRDETSGSRIKENNWTERRAYTFYSKRQSASEPCSAIELSNI